jgi:hypothetical protein
MPEVALLNKDLTVEECRLSLASKVGAPLVGQAQNPQTLISLQVVGNSSMVGYLLELPIAQRNAQLVQLINVQHAE